MDNVVCLLPAVPKGNTTITNVEGELTFIEPHRVNGCIARYVPSRQLTHKDVLEVLYDLFCERCVPVHILSDNGSEFTAQRVRAWLSKLCVKPLFLERGSPWENGYIESFNGKMRDELLSGEIFYTAVKEAQVLIEIWRWLPKIC